ncbi:MAG TPA: hypothetical protein VE981_18845 [Planctomycetota bacterium]|nr:hypothetical protein [Planctomycetota bacterium]
MRYTSTARILLALTLILPAGPPAQALQDDKKAAAEEKKADEAAAKKAVDEFNEKLKEAKNLNDKALLIMNLGDFEPKDKCMVSPLGRFLGAVAGDINLLLVTSAAEALGKFRNIPQAAAVLSGALAGYKKNPYITAKICTAIGKVGHESSLATFEEQLKGLDAELACQAVWVIADFPGTLSIDALFKENARIDAERKKQNMKDEYKKVYDRVQPEILKAVKKVTAQPWPTIAELTIWWNRHATAFKDECKKKESERKSEAPASARTAMPPVLLVELTFRENAGLSACNSGASGSGFPTATLTPQKPSWSNVVPPNGGAAALDFDKTGGAYAVDLGGGAGIENIKNLKSFTITGWVLCWEVKEGAADKMCGAGNRIVSWFNPMKVNEGVDLVYRTDGSLQLGIGQWADQSPARSKAEQIPVFDSKATNVYSEHYAKWRFFAVTYDSGAASSHAKFYIGSRNADVKLVNAVDYNRGPSGSRISPTLTIGNVPPIVRPMAPERSFRGVMDEIRIYGSTLDGSGALTEPDLIKIQNRIVPEGKG